jgi:hypothetical protein
VTASLPYNICPGHCSVTEMAPFTPPHRCHRWSRHAQPASAFISA